MKTKLLHIIFILSVICPVYAQDEQYYDPFSLPEPPKGLISPEIHADRRVTFRLYAPDAVEVSLNSDCFGAETDTTPFGTSGGSVQMSKDSAGIWSYTTTYPVYPNFYTYDYLVDLVNNVTDPANPDDAWNQGSHFSVFAVGGDSIADLLVQQDVPHGRIERLEYYSEVYRANRRVAVYIPSDYDATAHNYPVMYLLHGISGDEMAWLSLGRTAQICDNFIARGEIDPMIVVMPNSNPIMSSDEDGVSTMTDNILGIPRLMKAEFEDSFEELIGLMHVKYRISSDKSKHIIAGISIGAHQAANIVKIIPDYFSCLGLFSPTLWKKQVPDFIADDDSFSYYIRMGRNDWVSWSLSLKFADRVCRKGYKVDIQETIGGHTWKWWRNYLIEFLKVQGRK